MSFVPKVHIIYIRSSIQYVYVLEISAKKNSLRISRQQLTFLTNNRFAAVIWFLIGPTLKRKMSNFGGITYRHRTIIFYHLTVITIIPSITDVHISKFSNKKIMIKERDIYRKREISKLYTG